MFLLLIFLIFFVLMMGFNLYDLFHDKRLEVEKFFLKEGINNFYYRKVQCEIMEYITLDDQVRHEAEQKENQK